MMGIPLLFAAAYLYPYLPHTGVCLCAFRIATGINCPGCGLTRSITALMHGDVAASVGFNPMGIFAVVLAVFLWLKVFYLKVVVGSDDVRLVLQRAINRMAVLLVAGLMMQWVLRLLGDWVIGMGY